MGRIVTNPPKPVVRVKVSPNNFNKLYALATSVHAGILANVGTFVTPYPTMVDFKNDADALASAIAGLGTKSNKGGNALRLVCINAATLVHTDLVALAAYVSNVVYDSFPKNPTLQAQVIASSGFAAKSPKSKIDRTQFVRFAKQVNSKKFPFTVGRISWKKSLGFYKGAKVNGYNIYIGGALIGSTTKTNYTLPPVTVAQLTPVTIRPFNAAGEGNAFTVHATQIP